MWDYFEQVGIVKVSTEETARAVPVSYRTPNALLRLFMMEPIENRYKDEKKRKQRNLC